MRQIFVYDTWAVRDLPVLTATVSLLEHSYMVTVTDIAARTGIDSGAVTAALDALDPVYVDFRKTTTGGDPRFWYVFKVTPEARRAVGQWPTAEALAGRLAQEFTTAARQEPDPERQGLLFYAARLIGDTLRDVTVRAAGQVLTPAFGGVPQPEMGYPVPEPEPPPAREEFASLVPLPELPELLRPERPAPVAGPAPADTAPTDAAKTDAGAAGTAPVSAAPVSAAPAETAADDPGPAGAAQSAPQSADQQPEAEPSTAASVTDAASENELDPRAADRRPADAAHAG